MLDTLCLISGLEEKMELWLQTLNLNIANGRVSAAVPCKVFNAIVDKNYISAILKIIKEQKRTRKSKRTRAK